MTSAPRILVLTSSHLCRNPRVVKEATTLSAAGYDVTVMSISARSDFEATDRVLMQNAPFRRRVLDYTQRSSSARFFQRATTWAARQAGAHLHLEFAQSLGPASALLRFSRAHPADLTIAHTEIPTWIASSLMADGRRVAVDIEDWYSEDLLFADRRSRPVRLLRRAEKQALRSAAYTSATSRSMASALAQAFDCTTPVVIHNTFPRQSTSRVDRSQGTEPPAFIWFSQTIGPGRGLELFLAAWSRTQQPSRLYLLGDVGPSYRAELLSRVSNEQRGKIFFLPIVPPDELPNTLARFDIGLALEPRLPVNRDITITNKIFQYMNAGLALVATATAGQGEVMASATESGLLVQAHETSILATQLDALLASPERIRRCQVASRQAACDRFTWEHDAPRLLAAVRSTGLTSP